MRLKQSEPVRLCPVCSAPDPILEGQHLWPRHWRCPSCGHALTVRAEVPCLAPELDGADVGFDPKAFAALAGIEGGHFWFRARNDLLAWLLRRHAPYARRILEIGCGTGFALHALRAACPSASIAGSELHSAGLFFARARHGAAVELIQADARRLCLRDALDVICALDVLEHIEDDAAVLGEIGLALRDGGVLLAAVPQHPWLWSRSDELTRHVRRYRSGEIETKARAAGFDVHFSDSYVCLLLPAMALSRLMDRIAPGRRRLAGAALDPVAREFKVSRGLNKAMWWVLRLEHLFRRAGLLFPFGGSCVIVARKRA
jgi:SAM-dependent methyltransferase